MKTAPRLSIIFAGEEFDGHDAEHPQITIRTAEGEAKINVRVRAMVARHLGRVAQLATKEAELVDFVCLVPAEADEAVEIKGWQRVPEGWADNLTDESHVLLYEAAKRLNFSRAATHVTRQIAAKKFAGELMVAAAEELTPLLMEMLAPMLSEISQKLGSPVSSPRRPADSSALVTPS